MRTMTGPARGRTPGGSDPQRPTGPMAPGVPVPGVPAPTVPGIPAPAPGGGGSNLGPAGGNSMPWLQAWEGPFAAPMSPTEEKGLGNINDFAENDFGLGGAQGYLDKVFGGEYLSGNEPNFAAIESSGQTLKDMEDERALREIGSASAAGGNALSGARMGTEADYMRGSNAQFQNMMAQLRAANYGRERGFQQDSVGQSRGLADTRMRGYGDQMAAGGLQRDIADRELGGQYGDFLRQGQEFKDASRYPDELALATGKMNYPGYHTPSYGESDASQLPALIAQLFGGGGIDLAGGISDFVGGLAGTDGVPVEAYDGEDAGAPTSYRDSEGYNRSLTSMQAKNAAEKGKAGKASGASKAMTLLALLAQIMGIGGGKGNAKAGGAKAGGGGGGQSLGGKAGEGLASLLGLDKTSHKMGGDASGMSYKTDKKGQMVPGSLKGKLETRKDNSGLMSGLPEIGMEHQGGDSYSEQDWNDALGEEFGHNEFDNLGGYNDQGGGYSMDEGPSPSLGWGDSNPNTADMGGFDLFQGSDPFAGMGGDSGGINDFSGFYTGEQKFGLGDMSFE